MNAPTITGAAAPLLSGVQATEPPPEGDTLPVFSVPDLLQRLATWMQASGIDSAHEWQVGIRLCLAQLAGCKVAPFDAEGQALADLGEPGDPVQFLHDLSGRLDAAGYDEAHPWQAAIAATLDAELVAGDGQAPQVGSVAAVAGSADEVQDRLRYELQPLLQALERLTNSIRVLRAVEMTADMSPDFRAELRRRCPGWASPLLSGAGGPPDAVVHDLASLAASLCRELSDLDSEGGAA